MPATFPHTVIQCLTAIAQHHGLQINPERLRELFAELEQFSVRHEDQDMRNITYRRSDGRFCIIDFEFATILDGGDGRPVSLKPSG